MATRSVAQRSLGEFVGKSSDRPVEFHSVQKSANAIYLYNHGSLDCIRYDVKTRHFDTMRYDRDKIETLAYKCAFPATGLAQQRVIHSIIKNEPTLRVQALTADADTITTLVALYSVDTAKQTPTHGTLDNTIVMIRLVGDRLVSMEECGALDSAVVSMTSGNYAPTFEYAIARPGYYVLPLWSQYGVPDSKTLVRMSKSSPVHFLATEKLGLPQKNLDEKLNYDYLIPVHSGDFFMHSSSKQLYQFSTQQVYDLTSVLAIDDTSKPVGTYSTGQQVHDLSDLGNGRLALLVRNGSNLRKVDCRIENGTIRRTGITLLAQQYPNAEHGWPTLLVDGTCWSYSKNDKTFREIATR